MSVLFALIISWIFFLAAGARYAGWGSKVIWSWHPALGLAEVIVLGCSLWRAVPAALLGLIIWGACAYQWWFVSQIAVVMVFGPLPAYLLEAARRDAFLQNLKVVTINPLDPIHTTTKRVIRDGQAIEQPAMVYWFLPPAELTAIPNLGQADRTMLDRYHLGGGLYAAEATNSFLQFFDSLDLYKNLVDSSNEKAMGAFVQAIKFYLGLSDGARPGVLPPAAKPRPVDPLAREASLPESRQQQTTASPIPAHRSSSTDEQEVLSQPADPEFPAPAPAPAPPDVGIAEALAVPAPGKSKYKNWKAANPKNKTKGQIQFKPRGGEND